MKPVQPGSVLDLQDIPHCKVDLTVPLFSTPVTIREGVLSNMPDLKLPEWKMKRKNVM